MSPQSKHPTAAGHPRPWSISYSASIMDADGKYIGGMGSRELAHAVVSAINAQQPPSESLPREGGGPAQEAISRSIEELERSYHLASGPVLVAIVRALGRLRPLVRTATPPIAPPGDGAGTGEPNDDQLDAIYMDACRAPIGLHGWREFHAAVGRRALYNAGFQAGQAHAVEQSAAYAQDIANLQSERRKLINERDSECAALQAQLDQVEIWAKRIINWDPISEIRDLPTLLGAVELELNCEFERAELAENALRSVKRS